MCWILSSQKVVFKWQSHIHTPTCFRPGALPPNPAGKGPSAAFPRSRTSEDSVPRCLPLKNVEKAQSALAFVFQERMCPGWTSRRTTQTPVNTAAVSYRAALPPPTPRPGRLPETPRWWPRLRAPGGRHRWACRRGWWPGHVSAGNRRLGVTEEPAGMQEAAARRPCDNARLPRGPLASTSSADGLTPRLWTGELQRRRGQGGRRSSKAAGSSRTSPTSAAAFRVASSSRSASRSLLRQPACSLSFSRAWFRWGSGRKKGRERESKWKGAEQDRIQLQKR